MEKQHYYDLDESWLGLSNFLRAPTATHVRGTAFQIARVQRASLCAARFHLCASVLGSYGALVWDVRREAQPPSPNLRASLRN